MNFLAHIYLSGNDDPLKIGNFIADAIKGKKYLDYPKAIQRGIVLHRAIDSYTDTHPVVRQSISRLFPKYRHYSGVIVDLIYDHFLAANWQQYSKIPLAAYCDNFYTLLEAHTPILPKRVLHFMPNMIKENWILSYATIPGIGRILDQMNQRTKNRSKMNFAVMELEEFYQEFQNDFQEFFPDLERHVYHKISTLLS